MSSDRLRYEASRRDTELGLPVGREGGELMREWGFLSWRSCSRAVYVS